MTAVVSGDTSPCRMTGDRNVRSSYTGLYPQTSPSVRTLSRLQVSFTFTIKFDIGCMCVFLTTLVCFQILLTRSHAILVGSCLVQSIISIQSSVTQFWSASSLVCSSWTRRWFSQPSFQSTLTWCSRIRVLVCRFGARPWFNRFFVNYLLIGQSSPNERLRWSSVSNRFGLCYMCL